MGMWEDIKAFSSGYVRSNIPDSEASKAYSEGLINTPTYLFTEPSSRLRQAMAPVGEAIQDTWVEKALNGVGALFSPFIPELQQTDRRFGIDPTTLSPEEQMTRKLTGQATGDYIMSGVGGGITRQALKTPQNLKGQMTTEGEMIIPGFYGIRKPTDVPTPFDSQFRKQTAKYKEAVKAGEEIPKTLKWTGNENYQNALRAIWSGLKWGVTGSGRALKSTLDPRQRAMYADHGISKVDLDAVEKYQQQKEKLRRFEELADPTKTPTQQKKGYNAQRRKLERKVTEARNLAQQQLQATANIRRQANVSPEQYENIMGRVAIDASEPDVLTRTGGKPYFKPKLDKPWYHDVVDPKGNPTDNQIFQDHIISAQKVMPEDDLEIIVKRASAAETGKHWEDIGKTQIMEPLGEVFADIGRQRKAQFPNQRDTIASHTFDTNQQLYDALKPRLEAHMDALRKKHIPKNAPSFVKSLASRKIKTNYSMKFTDPKDIEKYGVWIKGSTVGSAKVEGGVNFLMKIDRNGRVKMIMNDKHDFLEKVPVLGKMLKNKLPTDVIAVSKPMEYDVFSGAPKSKEKVGGFNKEIKEALSDKMKPTYETGRKGLANKAFTEQVSDRLDEISNLKPSGASVRREAMGMLSRPAQAATGAAIATDRLFEEQP